MVQADLPLVSVITPSFNQSRYIRETIESVASQDYPNIEHIVVDGGSTDGTVELLQSYGHLGDRFRFVSEADRGQSHAINKGLQMARGSIIGWLNSDDTYLPGAVRKVVDTFQSSPEYAMVYGKAHYINEASQTTGDFNVLPFDRNMLYETCIICQPAAFIRRDVFVRMGGVDESLKFCMDYDLWIRISNHQHPIGYIDDYLANSRLHDACKSVVSWADVGLPEIIQTCLRHYRSVSATWLSEFMRTNGQGPGPQWLIDQLKAHFLLGDTPSIISMNRFHDFWVPPRFRIVIASAPGEPIRSLLVRGQHVIPFLHRRRSARLRLTAYVNGRRVKRFAIRPGGFQIEIPVSSRRSQLIIELVASARLIPSRAKMNADRRRLSYLVDEVIPCSGGESEFYRLLHQDPALASHWLRSKTG